MLMELTWQPVYYHLAVFCFLVLGSGSAVESLGIHDERDILVSVF